MTVAIQEIRKRQETHRNRAAAEGWLQTELASVGTLGRKFDLDGKAVVDSRRHRGSGDSITATVEVRLPRDEDGLKAMASLAERGYHVGEIDDGAMNLQKSESFEGDA